MRWKSLLFLSAVSALLFGCLPKPIPSQPGTAEWGLDVTWHGHSCFTLRDSIGRTVVIDPFDDTVGYGRLTLRADALLTTHSHFDHNEKNVVRPRLRDVELVESTGAIAVAGGLTVAGVESNHDNEGGGLHGKNRIYFFIMGGLRVVHLGDLGQDQLTRLQKSALGAVDVLFIPVGGVTTLDAAQAKKIVKELKPRFVFPMHYGDIRFYKLDPVEDFLKLFPESSVSAQKESSIRVRLSEATDDPRIITLTPVTRNY